MVSSSPSGRTSKVSAPRAAPSTPRAARSAGRAAPAGAARPRPKQPRFEIDRRIVLRVLFVLVVIAFFAVFVRVASIGFEANVRGVDKLDRQMASPPAASGTQEPR